MFADSIIRNVKSKMAATDSAPDVLVVIPNLFDERSYVQNIVIHVGTNDLAAWRIHNLIGQWGLFHYLKRSRLLTVGYKTINSGLAYALYSFNYDYE